MILSPILVLDPQKVERDLAFVMDCLAEVLDEAGSTRWRGNSRGATRRRCRGATLRFRPNGCRGRTRSRSTC